MVNAQYLADALICLEDMRHSRRGLSIEFVTRNNVTYSIVGPRWAYISPFWIIMTTIEQAPAEWLDERRERIQPS